MYTKTIFAVNHFTYILQFTLFDVDNMHSPFRYIDRNLEELEQITMKHTIGGRTSHQHASRRDRIKITRENETALFNGAGFGEKYFYLSFIFSLI